MNRFADNLKNMSIAAKASILLGLFVLIFCGMIWPGRVLSHSTERRESVSNPHKESEPLSGEFSLEGKFVGLGGHLKTLGFRMSGISSGDDDVSGSALSGSADPTKVRTLPALLLTVSDESGAELYSGSLPYKSLKNNEYAEFPVNFDTVRAETYSYSLSFSDAESGFSPEKAPRVQLGSEDSLPEEELFGWYAAAPQLALYPLMSFSYEAAPTLQSALPYWMVILFLFALILGALGIFGTRAAPFLAVFFVCFYACAFLCLTDEGKTPIRLTGRELENLTGNHDYDYVGISDRADLAGTMAKTKDFTLNPGTYVLGVGYGTDTSLNTVSVTDNGSYIAEYTLDASECYREYTLELPKGSQFFTVSFNYCGQGYLIVNSFSLAPQERFYTDNLLLILFTVLLGVGLELCLFWKLLRKSDNSENCCNSGNRGFGERIPAFLIALFLAALAVFAMHPYFVGYLPYGDDVCYHLIRIEGTKDGLLSGQFPVVLYPEGANGHGYLGWMYPSLFLYLPALMRILGASTSLAWKTLVFSFHLLTAVTTYFSVKAVTRSKAAGLFSSVLYVLAPYRLCCFIARAALGEALAFAFFPLLFAGLYLTLYDECGESRPLFVKRRNGAAGEDALKAERLGANRSADGDETVNGAAGEDALKEELKGNNSPTGGNETARAAAGANVLKAALNREKSPAGGEQNLPGAGVGIKKAQGNMGWLYLALGLTGLLQTHILSCLMGLIFCVVFGLIRVRYIFRKERLLQLCKAAVFTLILNLWYLVPFLDLYLNARLSTDSLAWSKYSEYSLLPVSIFGTFGTGDYRMYALGVPLILALGAYAARRLSPCKDHSGPQAQGEFAAHKGTDLHEYTDLQGHGSKQEDAVLREYFPLQGHGVLQEHNAVQGNCSRRESFTDLCAVLAVSCLILTLCFFPARSLMASFPALDALFTNLQFPWRLLGVVSFLCAMLGGAALFGADPGKAEEDREAGMCCRQAGDVTRAPVSAECEDMETGAGERRRAAEIPDGRYVSGPYAMTDCRNMRAGAAAGCDDRVGCNRLCVALGIALAVLAIAMVPRYNTANGDYYAYASYDAEYTEGHYMKLIGIPKAKHTIVYPYEWMPEGAGEAEALGASEVVYLPDDAGIVDSSYIRNGLVSQFEYVIGEDAAPAGEQWAVLPLFAYGGYEAVDETGRRILPEYEDSSEAGSIAGAANGSEAESVAEAAKGSVVGGVAGAVNGSVAGGVAGAASNSAAENISESGYSVADKNSGGIGGNAEAANGTETGDGTEYAAGPAMRRNAGGLLLVPLSNVPGVHSYTVTYRAPVSVAAGGWASIIGLLCFAAVSVILNRRKSRQAL